MTDKEILLARLSLFLKERGAYDKFITNLTNYENIESLCEYEARFNNQQHSISDAFTWDNTPEGVDYWSKLYYDFWDNYNDLPTNR